MMKKSFILALALAAGLAVSGCQQGNAPGQPAAVVGNPAPDFTLMDTSGKTWSLSSLKGNVVFLNFWATWCPPCRQEMPSMERLHKEMAGKPFRMVTILYQDDPSAAAAYAREGGYTFPVLIDQTGEAARAYGLTGVPETYIVDQDGILKEKFIGPREWSTNPLKASISRMLPPGT